LEVGLRRSLIKEVIVGYCNTSDEVDDFADFADFQSAAAAPPAGS